MSGRTDPAPSVINAPHGSAVQEEVKIHHRILLRIIVLTISAVATTWAPAQSAGLSASHAPLTNGPTAFGRLPLGFEPNVGQTGVGNLFVARSSRYAISLTKSSMIVGAKHSVRVHFTGTNGLVRVTGMGKLPGTVNYLIGDIPSAWHLDIPTFRTVEYHNLYPGIDLTYGDTGTTIEATWKLAAGVNPGRIKMTIAGISALRLGPDGALIAATLHGRFIISAPIAYQSIDGTRRYIPAGFHLGTGGRVTLWSGPYDRAVPLVIDPTLSYATELGGSSSDFAGGIAVDGAGNTYIAGSTSSPDFPVLQAVQPREPGTTDQEDAFVAKLNPTGTALLFSTYLGGNNDEDGAAIALGRGGGIYVTGFTRSTNFPQRHALPGQKGGCNSGHSVGGDAFVAKLSSRGDRLLYSTCLGGTGTDWGTGIAVDRGGAAVVTGSTGSNNFPTANPLQPHRAGSVDAFVARLVPGGGKLLYSTYLGGEGVDQSTGLALDRAGSVYVVGSTDSSRFPRKAPLQPRLTGSTDAFVTKLDPSGRHIVYATYLGGSGADAALGVAVDGEGDTYVTGATESRNFPIAHALQSTLGGATDAFIAELAPDGASTIFSTYLGGVGNDEATAIALDAAGRAHITGSTASSDFPLRRPMQATYAGGYFYGDAFAADLTVDGQSLAYSTYLGGKGDDVGTAVAANAAGDAYITGGTSSEDFPVSSSLNGGRPSRGNAFVVRVVDNSSLPLPGG